ncbi:S8 family serine peptidase [Flavobacterium sp. LaA7.5]|nr:S8 family serine peptidase [Flavobacterium salilacus subsp. altitudinum]
MKSKLVLLALFLFVAEAFSQTQPTEKCTVYVCFKDSQFHATDAFQSFLTANNASIAKAVKIPENQFEYLKKQSQKLRGNSDSVEKLNRIYNITLFYENEALLNKSLEELSLFEEVEYAVKANTQLPPPPPGDILPVTPSYFFSQGYIQSNPGVNMQYAWDIGYAGEGIRVRDIEYGVNINHEELNSTNTSLADDMTVFSEVSSAYTEHGTASIGVIYADNGEYGISGMAHEVDEVILFPEWTEENGYNRVYAITQAINNSVAGDIIMYEMQASAFTENDFVPAEYNNVVWDLTKAATDAGIVIVAAAGNGSQNLDSAMFNSYTNRGDSGAIIVGAGSYDTNHDRLYFSTYGSRVNVQAWGQNVITTGYGDLYAIGNDFNQYYTLFSGTSSATPIIASCAAVLQSYYYDRSGEYLTSQEIRDILVQTGISQGVDTIFEPIGPLPDMEAAIAYINTNLLGNKEYSLNGQQLRLFPNPADEKLTISLENSNGGFEIKIFNTLGQIVYGDTSLLNKKEIDIADLKSGIYFVEIKNQNKVYTKRIIKK